MRVLLVTLEYPPFKGGVAEYYQAIFEFWPRHGQIEVLHNQKKILVTPDRLFLKWLPSVWQIFKKIRLKKINHLLVGHILPLGTAVYIVTRLTGTPYAIIMHGMDFTFALKQRRKKILAKIILNKADKIICASSYTASLISEFIGEKQSKKIFTVNPGINPSQIINQKRVDELVEKHKLQGKKIIFSLGRLVKRKGFDMMIKAMPEILKSYPGAAYYIAGAGPDERYLKDTAAKLFNHKNKIFFLGKISEEDKRAWLYLCDIFAMPARLIRGAIADRADSSGIINGGDFEGFGIVYLEAALAGKPVIAGRSGGVEDAVVDYETGILVNPESVEDIADGTLELLGKRRLSQTLGEQGRRRAIEEFNWEKQVRKIYHIINYK